MRIGIDCRALQETFPSGVSVYTKHLLDALFALPAFSEKHIAVLFFNGFRVEHSVQQRALQQEWKDAPVEWRIHNWPNKFLTLSHAVTRFPSIRTLFGDVDIVYVPNIQFFPWRDHTTPFVMTVHDLSFERYADCLSTKGKLRHYFVEPQKMISHASRIVAVSKHTADDLHELYSVPREKIEVVYPGVIHASASIETPSTKIPDRYILALATIEPRKNIDALLNAFSAVHKQFSDVELIVVGQPGWKSTHTIARMQSMQGVRYMGYVDESLKQKLLQHATLSVYPSVYEGFGFPPLEAQEHGVPVIAGNHSSLPEVLGNSALYVDVLDIDSLTRGMRHLLTDQMFRDNLIVRGHANVARFQWSASAQQFLDIIENTV